MKRFLGIVLGELSLRVSLTLSALQSKGNLRRQWLVLGKIATLGSCGSPRQVGALAAEEGINSPRLMSEFFAPRELRWAWLTKWSV